MPGTPESALGSDAVTLAATLAGAAFFAAAPYALSATALDPATFAVAGGVAYALACLTVWTGARVLTGAFADMRVKRPLGFVGVSLVATVFLWAEVAIPYYLYARWAFLAPMAGAFVAAWVTLSMFAHVRGESDPLGLYPFAFGPVLLGVVVALSLAEASVRYLVGV
ncbi:MULTISPECIES: hypothetical protein [Halorussus]|uniref:hypothetical protein n=1 Tax=Halorussus TaxID=1070314 RepID=UPI00209CEB53|nr:hypothetical protein [Halorussus vallis]USZ76377.1 hypothetical protein NGM07_03380 [Halorussus vallis]